MAIPLALVVFVLVNFLSWRYDFISSLLVLCWISVQSVCSLESGRYGRREDGHRAYGLTRV